MCSPQEERKQESTPIGNGHVAIPSPLTLPPFRLLGLHTRAPSKFLKPPGLVFHCAVSHVGSRQVPPRTSIFYVNGIFHRDKPGQSLSLSLLIVERGCSCLSTLQVPWPQRLSGKHRASPECEVFGKYSVGKDSKLSPHSFDALREMPHNWADPRHWG